jgi:hypothetical protein
MADERAGGPASYRGISVLIHGSGETAMAVLAAALARQEVGSFGWADCTAAAEVPESGARWVLEEGSEASYAPRVVPDDLLPAHVDDGGIGAWLVRDPAGTETAARLAAYLRLPSVIQRMVARTVSSNARAVLVLTNVDALPGISVDRSLGPIETHETLHREGVTLLVTFRGNPTNILRAPFDRVYRVDGRADLPWQEARVAIERGGPDDGLASGETLGTRLPWLGLSGSPLGDQRPHPHHRLR